MWWIFPNTFLGENMRGSHVNMPGDSKITWSCAVPLSDILFNEGKTVTKNACFICTQVRVSIAVRCLHIARTFFWGSLVLQKRSIYMHTWSGVQVE